MVKLHNRSKVLSKDWRVHILLEFDVHTRSICPLINTTLDLQIWSVTPMYVHITRAYCCECECKPHKWERFVVLWQSDSITISVLEKHLIDDLLDHRILVQSLVFLNRCTMGLD